MADRTAFDKLAQRPGEVFAQWRARVQRAYEAAGFGRFTAAQKRGQTAFRLNLLRGLFLTEADFPELFAPQRLTRTDLPAPGNTWRQRVAARFDDAATDRVASARALAGAAFRARFLAAGENGANVGPIFDDEVEQALPPWEEFADALDELPAGPVQVYYSEGHWGPAAPDMAAIAAAIANGRDPPARPMRATWGHFRALEYRHEYIGLDYPVTANARVVIAKAARAILQGIATYGGAPAVILRFVPVPANDPGNIRLRDGVTNCAIGVLTAKFKGGSRPKRLRKIALRDDGSFGPEQAYEAACILGRVVELRDRLGGLSYAAGVGEYEVSPKCPAVVIYNFDGHAVAGEKRRVGGVAVVEAPRYPDTKGAPVVLVDYDCSNIWDIKADPAVGALALAWQWPHGATVRKADGSVCVVRERRCYEAVRRRAEELGVEHVEAVRSPFAVEVMAWQAAHRIEKTPPEFEDLWRSAHQPFRHFYRNARPAVCADINLAFEGSIRGGAADLFQRYGLPAAEGMVAFRDPPLSILEETGVVVAELDIARCHWWPRYVAQHSRIAITTMRLKLWLDEGAAVLVKLELAVVARKEFPTLARPAGALWSSPKELPFGREEGADYRRWGAEAVGRLVPSEKSSATAQEYQVIDGAEAASIISLLRAEGRLEYHSHNIAAGYYTIRERQKGRTRGCFHTHAYLLDYAAAVVDREIFMHPAEAIVKVATDCIALAEGHTFTPAVVFGTEPGQWKRVEVIKMPASAGGTVYDWQGVWKDAWDVEVARFGALRRHVYDGKGIVSHHSTHEPDAEKAAAVAGPYWDKLLPGEPRSALIVHGFPGSGKTFGVTAKLAGHPFIALTPTHKLKEVVKRMLGLRGPSPAPNARAYTRDWIIALSKGVPSLKTRAGERPKIEPGGIVFLPEIGLWPKATAAAVIPWLTNDLRCRVFCDGDRRQMEPPGDGAEPPWPWLDAHCRFDEIETWPGAKDHRSKTPELAAFKRELRKLDTNEAVLAAVSAFAGFCDFDELLERWHPRDFVYVSVHGLRNVLTRLLAEIHASKYPAEPLRVRFTSDAGTRSGEEVYQPLGEPLPSNSEPGYATTYSSCQGETASAGADGVRPKIWLTDYKLDGPRWEKCFRFAAAMAATRAEHEGQLCTVLGPWPEEELTEAQSYAREKKKLDARDRAVDRVWYAVATKKFGAEAAAEMWGDDLGKETELERRAAKAEEKAKEKAKRAASDFFDADDRE